MKTCSKCRQQKCLDDFPKNKIKADGLAYNCKVCQREYIREHYRQNKDYYLKKARKRNKSVKLDNGRKVIEYLQQHPCVDCGETDPIYLEFDHVRGEKQMNISSMVPSCSWRRIQEEIVKCEIRCVKCHRLKTFRDIGWWGFTILKEMACECER